MGLAKIPNLGSKSFFVDPESKRMGFSREEGIVFDKSGWSTIITGFLTDKRLNEDSGLLSSRLSEFDRSRNDEESRARLQAMLNEFASDIERLNIYDRAVITATETSKGIMLRFDLTSKYKPNLQKDLSLDSLK